MPVPPRLRRCGGHVASLLLIIACLGGLAASASAADDTRIAIIDRAEIIELIKIRVLARPENAAAKQRVAQVEEKQREVQKSMSDLASGGSKDERLEIAKRMSAIYQEKREAEAGINGQIDAELIRVVKEATKGQYPLVLDADAYKEALVTKNALIVDITVDVKEHLLSK